MVRKGCFSSFSTSMRREIIAFRIVNLPPHDSMMIYLHSRTVARRDRMSSADVLSLNAEPHAIFYTEEEKNNERSLSPFFKKILKQTNFNCTPKAIQLGSQGDNIYGAT